MDGILEGIGIRLAFGIPVVPCWPALAAMPPVGGAAPLLDVEEGGGEVEELAWGCRDGLPLPGCGENSFFAPEILRRSAAETGVRLLCGVVLLAAGVMPFDLPPEIGVVLLGFPEVGVELLACEVVVLGGVSPLGGVLRVRAAVALWRGLLCFSWAADAVVAGLVRGMLGLE